MNKQQFDTIIEKVMEFNGYSKKYITAKGCEMEGLWTPCDLILREFYNNGGGSAEGFLGITQKECLEAFYYIKNNVKYFKDNDLISAKGYSNSGWLLWTNYDIH